MRRPWDRAMAVANRTLYRDALNNPTSFVYDGLNREIERIDPLGNRATFVYAAAAFMFSNTDRLGRRRDFTCDGLGRQTGEIWLRANGSEADRITFTYDAAGNQLSAANKAGAYNFTYDALNRVIAVQEPFGVNLNFTYDAVGHRTRVEDSFGGLVTSV